MNPRTLLALALLHLPLLLGGCAAAPASAAADASVAGFAFLEGVWTLEQKNGAVIEESWSAPRGKSVLGSFRRVLGNGIAPFYEFTQIVVDDKDGVLLRQIHVHGNFDTDPRRAKPMVLRLEGLDRNRASFVPFEDDAKSNAGSLARVTYTLEEPRTLVLVVEPRAPKDGSAAEPPLEFRMTKVR